MAENAPGGRTRPGANSVPVHYVPGELCLVVEFSSPVPEERGGELQEALRALMAGVVNGLKDSAPSVKSAALRHDLRPTDNFWRAFQETPGRFQLTSPDRQPTRAANPWIVGRTPLDNRTLHFFRFGAPVDLKDPRDVTVRHDQTRDLVKALNLVLPLEFRGPTSGTCRVVAATPNWLVGSAQHISGSPGGAPVPPPVGPPGGGGIWRFRGNGQLAALKGHGAGVTVAILDASPTQALVDHAARNYGNRLLRSFATGRRPVIESGPVVASDYLDGYKFRSNYDFTMADHGLFAAGIIREIADKATIRLIRVLNDHGVGDLWALAEVLGRLPDGKPLVVNLSLGIDLPPGEQLLADWFPRTRDELGKMPHGSEVRSWLTAIGRQDVLPFLARLDHSLSWIDAQRQMLIVAAAGNDNARYEQPAFDYRPEPRLPARYDNVLGVAAVKRTAATTAGPPTFGPSSYSNRGDVNRFGNGVATFGGDVLSGPGSSFVTDASDAVVGIFSNRDYPNGAGMNRTGWASWAGTSFAAPIISAVAACVWTRTGMPLPSPADILATVPMASGALDPDLDCPVIATWQT